MAMTAGKKAHKVPSIIFSPLIYNSFLGTKQKTVGAEPTVKLYEPYNKDSAPQK
jgi:hypothetical protein